MRNAGAGTYRIRGKLVSFKDGELVIMAGNRKISGTASDDLTINVNLDDPTLGQKDDKVEVKAWYYGPQQAQPGAQSTGHCAGSGGHDHAGQAPGPRRQEIAPTGEVRPASQVRIARVEELAR